MAPRPNTTPVTRRQFLAQTAILAAADTCVGCAGQSAAANTARRTENAGIIDTHTHFYDPKRPQGVPWPPKGDPILYRTVLPEEYQKLATPLGISGTVVVEASPLVEDNQWILDLAAKQPFIRGLVGHLEPGAKNFRADLKRFAANPLFRGIRIGVWDPAIQFDQPKMISDLKAVSDLGLAVDVLVRPAQLLALADLADKLPELRLVIDHCANVAIDGKTPPDDWTAGIHAVARRRNVHMKVSGLVEGTGQAGGSAPNDTEFYRPILDTMWKTFGPDRLIFGSNWPVCTRFADLATVKSIVENYFTAKEAGTAARYFRLNALKVYRSL